MKRILCTLCLLALCVLSCACARAEALLSVCINEICASNGGHFTINGAAPDYVELRNLTDQALPLDGFFISDDEDHPKKFSLAGYTLPENGYLVLAADKKELPFKLSASGGEELLLADAEGAVLQRVSLPPLAKDETYSRQEDGDWQLTDPTPLAANGEGVPYVEKVYVASPRFSHAAGFYEEPFDLTLEGYKTYRLYYTTDGSVPDEHSTLYTGPIHIADATAQPNTLSMRTDVMITDPTPPSSLLKKATIIRAVAIDPDGNRSNEVTNTYFVGFQAYEAYQDIAILSIVADPYDLFDEQDGIYVRGKTYQAWLADEDRDQNTVTQLIPTNYRMHGKEWEIPVTIQWFDEENALCLTQNAGARIHGNWSREAAKKSINLYARKEYGASAFQYDILPGLPGKEKLVVRANLGKDSLVHAMLKETGLLVSDCTPCLLFLNGEFWGLYEIREKEDEKDIAGHFGLNKDDLLVIKNKELVAGTAPAGTKSKGVRAVYTDLLAEISSYDASTPQGYEDISAIMDVENYISCMAGLTFLNNSDYRNNFTLWRTAEKGDGEYADARWRWIFQDLDYCCYYYEGLIDIVTYLPEDVIFSTLWQNEGFQTAFLTRVMDFANVELTADYVRAFITPIYTYYEPYLKETYVRFPGKNSSLAKPGAKEIANLMPFFLTRREGMIEQLTETFSLTRGTATLTLSGLIEGLPLEINGHTAHLYESAWSGVYFQGCAVTFTVGDIPGYEFVGWYAGDELLTEERTVEVSTDVDRTLTPVYEELPVVALMNETERLYGTGAYGFTKALQDSDKQCLLLADSAIQVERKYLDSTITFHLDASIQEPQGITLSLPLGYYESMGGVITLAVPESSAPLTWRMLCRGGEGDFRELAAEQTTLASGSLRFSFTLPAELLENTSLDLRLEATAVGPASFTLHGFRIYGVPMAASLAMAHEYARVVRAIGADDRYAPDFERMADWSAEEIEAEIVSLRSALQSALAGDALTFVGALEPFSPAWEGLEAYPAVLIDDSLIQAYYNEEGLLLSGDFSETVYLYKAAGDTLSLLGVEETDGSALPMSLHAGVFFLLDQPVEALRFRADFDDAPIPDDLLFGVFFAITPRNHLWMDVETFTQYQEEIVLALPEAWSGNQVFVYRLEGGELAFVAEADVEGGAFRFTPADGRFLLLDKTLESFAEQADWEQREIADLKRIQAQEARQQAQFRRKMLLLGGGFCGAILAVVVLGVLLHHRRAKKKRK